ncbi:MAG: hypothetical protein LUC93_16260 [Planctomycetaceae bacterium]|nr:hypothetical protein [Planctomycetaceae bacterium]
MSLPGFLKKIDPLCSKVLLPAAEFISRRGFFSKKLSLPTPLIIRPGGLGDLVCCHMALESLGLDPTDFNWLIERRSAAWARHHGFSYQCYDQMNLRDWADGIGKYETIINTEQYYGLSQITALAMLKKEGRLYSFDSNLGKRAAICNSRYSQNDDHETVLFAELFAMALHVPYSGTSIAFRERIIAERDYVLLALGGGDAPSRRLTAVQWADFAKAVVRNRKLIVSCSVKEKDLLEDIKILLPEAEIIDNDFESFIKCLSRAAQVVTIDSGAVHIASYYGVPTTVLFTSGQDKKWAPIAESSTIHLNNEAYCRPCTIWGQTSPCLNNYQCKNIAILIAKPYS